MAEDIFSKLAAASSENEPCPNKNEAITDLYNESQSEEEKDGAQRRNLRGKVAVGIFVLLALEIVWTAWMIDRQGRGVYLLEKWTFGVFCNAVILQTFLNLKIVVEHLFPKGGK